MRCCPHSPAPAKAAWSVEGQRRSTPLPVAGTARVHRSFPIGCCDGLGQTQSQQSTQRCLVSTGFCWHSSASSHRTPHRLHVLPIPFLVRPAGSHRQTSVLNARSPVIVDRAMTVASRSDHGNHSSTTARNVDGSRFSARKQERLWRFVSYRCVTALGRGDTPAAFSRRLCRGASYPEPSSALASLGSALGSRRDC